MKRIKILLCAFLLLCSGLWFFADSLLPQPFTYFSFRYVFNQYSGIMAINAMSLCMILATRPTWLESILGGLDKIYRLHKWLGITALISTLAHFWFTEGTKWMVGWGWLTRPARKAKPNTLSEIEQWLGSMRNFAEDVGEWAFYIVLVLLVMALIKRFPYHWFAKLHTYLAVTYLALAFHSLILMKFSYWQHGIAWLSSILMLSGVISALIILLQHKGKSRRIVGNINNIVSLPSMNAFALEVKAPQWHGHHAGQFAFLHHTKDKEGAHPFTIASAWNAQTGIMRFIIKNLGDYTAKIPQTFQVGDAVTLEGPYGCFTFEDNADTQIWVAAGIGITPFLARLEALANSTHAQKVHMIYSYRDESPEFVQRLQAMAKSANVELHLWPSHQKGRLNAKDLYVMVQENLTNCSVWFCGNTNFALSLKKDLQSLGLTEKNFHQELFEMR